VYHAANGLHSNHESVFYDSKHDVAIMHGGVGRSDTWVYDARDKTWTELVGANGPLRNLHGTAYDARNDAVIIFSGAASSGVALEQMFALRYQPAGPRPNPPTAQIVN
jgi:hypothetical protein